MFVNSGLWDVNRVGPLAHQDFRTSLNVFTAGISRSVPSGLCFWLTTPPSKYHTSRNIEFFSPRLSHYLVLVSEETSGKGMTVPCLEQQNFLTRFNVNCVNKVNAFGNYF